jgi:flagellar biosynthetic protein FlhB
MADERDNGQDRSESPTPRRREDARSQGRVARSPEVSAAAVVLGGTLALGGFGGTAIADYMGRLLRGTLGSLAAGPLTVEGAVAVLRQAASGMLLALLPFSALLVVTVLLVDGLQAGGVLSWKPVAPQFERISPVAGFKRLLGPEALFQLAKSVLKLAALAAVSVWIIVSSARDLGTLSEVGPQALAAALRGLTLRLALASGGAFLLIAGIDYLFQRLRHERQLRMTRDELRKEMRETEGDPLVKARMQSLARARARQRMMQKVPQADVVVVNPVHIAVALRYDVAVAAAPIVVAMGQRKLAERIKSIALRHGVPVIENRPVAHALLASARVGRPIPPALYAAIAEILAFVYRRRARPAASPAIEQSGP